MPKVTKNSAPAKAEAAKPEATGKGNVPAKKGGAPAKKAPAPKPAKKAEAPVAAVEEVEGADAGEQEVSTGSLTRHDVAAALREKVIASGAALPEKLAEQVVKSFEEVVSDALSHGKDITLPGFGKFVTTLRPARDGRNPRTGETVQIAASFKVAFKPGKSLKDAANSRAAE
jgi:DNA-binding protein HU-beta